MSGLRKQEKKDYTMINRREFLQGTACGLALLMFSSCRPSANTSNSGGQGIAALSDPPSLISGTTGAAIAQEYWSFIANGLIRLKLPDMTPEPDLANSWEISPDNKVYTFTLRSDVKWQDGESFTAEDVKYTFETFAHPEFPNPLSATLALVEGAQAFKEGSALEISGIMVLADNKISFTLTSPSSLFLTGTMNAVILPRHALKNVPVNQLLESDYARHPIYTGPFIVREWNIGESIKLEAFSEYFRGRPNLDIFVARAIPDENTIVAELQSGGIQLAKVSIDQFETFVSNSSFDTQALSGSTGTFLRFDLTNPLFTDKRVREAIAWAIDRETIIDSLFGGYGEPSFGLLSPLQWVYNPNIPKFGYNVQKSQSLLDAAGWLMQSDGIRAKEGMQLSFKMNTLSSAKDSALSVVPYLQAIGIDAQVDILELGAWIDALKPGSYECAFAPWTNFLNDPRTDLALNFQTGRPYDPSGYKNDRVDELFDKARQASSQAEEKVLFNELQEILAEDHVHVYLWRTQDLFVNRKELQIPKVKIMSQIWATLPDWTVDDK